jgi:putative DNA primase/helicase
MANPLALIQEVFARPAQQELGSADDATNTPVLADAPQAPTNEMGLQEKANAILEKALQACGPYAEHCIQLACLAPTQYAMARREIAKLYGVSVSQLDNDVKAHRRNEGGDSLQGQAIDFDDPDPWDEPVDGAMLLNDLTAFVRRFCVLPEGGYDVTALWLVMTYDIDLFDKAPYLAAQSPEKGCGKSTFLDVLAALCYRHLATAGITPAALFRVIEQYKPTLIIDELDSVFSKEGNGEELRGVLNAGHSKNSMSGIIRCIGDTHEPRRFSVWSAKAMASIANLPDTLQSRSIVLRLHRKLPTDKLERLRLSRLAQEIDILKAKCVRWMMDNGEKIRTFDCDPAGLGNREADNWQPLYAIATAAGGDWEERVALAANALCSAAAAVSNPSVSLRLLTDIKELFDLHGWQKVPTSQLVEQLHKMDDRGWATEGGKNGLEATRLSQLLRQYGVQPRQYKSEGTKLRGYCLDDFREAFGRYLGGIAPSQAATQISPGTPVP